MWPTERQQGPGKPVQESSQTPRGGGTQSKTVVHDIHNKCHPATSARLLPKSLLLLLQVNQSGSSPVQEALNDWPALTHVHKLLLDLWQRLGGTLLGWGSRLAGFHHSFLSQHGSAGSRGVSASSSRAWSRWLFQSGGRLGHNKRGLCFQTGISIQQAFLCSVSEYT